MRQERNKVEVDYVKPSTAITGSRMSSIVKYLADIAVKRRVVALFHELWPREQQRGDARYDNVQMCNAGKVKFRGVSLIRHVNREVVVIQLLHRLTSTGL